MSISKRRTKPQRLASQANARKSTGPKTLAGKRISSQNSFKHGKRARQSARPLWQAMAALGEDPARYQTLLRDVLSSQRPSSALELRLCQDVTRLMLKSERNQQAQEAKVVRAFERLELSRQKQRREMELPSSYDAVQSLVLETGLRRAPDSPAKFLETTECLERLLERVQCGGFSDETELFALYGKNPTFQGAGIINSFRDLSKHPDDADLRSSLRVMILEETRNVAEEYELYLQEHVEISRAMRLECLAPAADRDYLQLERQEAALDQRLERKIKLLLAVRAANPQEAGDKVEPAVQEPLAWLQAAAPANQKASHPVVRAAALVGPEATQKTRSISLRHKLDTPRRPDRSKEEWQETLRRIGEVYGVDMEPNGPFAPVANAAQHASEPASVSVEDEAKGPQPQEGE
jgi:hypothetical protein